MKIRNISARLVYFGEHTMAPGDVVDMSSDLANKALAKPTIFARESGEMQDIGNGVERKAVNPPPPPPVNLKR